MLFARIESAIEDEGTEKDHDDHAHDHDHNHHDHDHDHDHHHHDHGKSVCVPYVTILDHDELNIFYTQNITMTTTPTTTLTIQALLQLA